MKIKFFPGSMNVAEIEVVAKSIYMEEKNSLKQ